MIHLGDKILFVPLSFVLMTDSMMVVANHISKKLHFSLTG